MFFQSPSQSLCCSHWCARQQLFQVVISSCRLLMCVKRLVNTLLLFSEFHNSWTPILIWSVLCAVGTTCCLVYS